MRERNNRCGAVNDGIHRSLLSRVLDFAVIVRLILAVSKRITNNRYWRAQALTLSLSSESAKIRYDRGR
jgi:hypothetical protein